MPTDQPGVPPSVVIRPFQPADARPVQRLVLGIQREEFGVPITLEEQPDLVDVPAVYRKGLGGFWVAADGGEVVGTVGLLDLRHGHGALRKMFVAPSHRGAARGVAGALLRTCLRWAAEAGMSEVYLGTTDSFRAAHRFYEKSGFAEVPADRLPAHFPRMRLDTKFYRYTLPRVQQVGREAFAEVTATLCDAFANYPVMRFVLGDSGNYRERLTTLIGFFGTARLLRDDPMLGVSAGAELSGVALVTLPGAAAQPAALAVAREETWAVLGTDARARYDACVRAWEPLAVAAPNVHLNMLGVRPRSQGQGISRLLLARVHALSRDRADSEGVTLTTEDARNLPLYRHFGYRVTGHARIAPGLETWGFFRPD